MRRRGSSTRAFVASFFGLIAIGTAGLLFLPGLYTGPDLRFVDALFTATSAVCVTGLIVVDTATYFTPLGQAWIALLIQLGGLGILTFTTLIFISFGRRASLASEEAVGAGARLLPRVDALGLLRSVLLVTFGLELIGAFMFWLDWRGSMGAAGAIWPAAFHAISAFCNAGFSVFSDSLVGFSRSPITLGVASALIVIGGLGFVVVEDLRGRYVRRASRRMTVHSRIVLVSTGVLLLGGTAAYLFFEWSAALGELGWPFKLLNAGFMSVTARTAGFNTVVYESLTNASIFLTVLLMLIGGSPNSTAGGFKTTTIAILGFVFFSRLRGRSYSIIAFDRSVPESTIERAAGLIVGGMIVLALCVFALTVLESGPGFVQDRGAFLRLVFEAHSAFGTVGLSMGATPDLDMAGRLVITFLMFVGRVGPLSVVAAMTFSRGQREPTYRLSQENILIG